MLVSLFCVRRLDVRIDSVAQYPMESIHGSVNKQFHWINTMFYPKMAHE